MNKNSGLTYVKDPNKLYISKHGDIYEHIGSSVGKTFGFPDKMYPCEILVDVKTNQMSHVLAGDFTQNFAPYFSILNFTDKTDGEIFKIVSEKLAEYLGASFDDVNKNNKTYVAGANALVDGYLKMYYETMEKPIDPRLRTELMGVVTYLFLSMKVMEKKKADEVKASTTPDGGDSK